MAERTKATVLKTVFGLRLTITPAEGASKVSLRPTAVVAEPFEVGTDLGI
jgi:hypothetical protein